MKRRWYRRCGADFIHGTMSLSLEEKGAYSLCLDLIYDRGGPIPNDERWLAGICNVSTRKWRSLCQRLIDLGKLRLVDGHLSNTRAEFEIISTETHARKLSESGAKGGRARAENAASTKGNNDLGEAGLKHIREKKRREEEKEEESNPPKGGRAYAFEGRVIRLKRSDFEQWQRSFPLLDLSAVLQSRDDWLATEADEKTCKRWFIATSNHLANLQQKAAAIERQPIWDGLP